MADSEHGMHATVPVSVQSTISPRVRVGLDLARAAAAIYVVLHHSLRDAPLPLHLGLLLRFGQEAVIVFFLLSGFVIFANEHERALHPRGYYLRRLRRIYPLVMAAGVVSTAVLAVEGSLLSVFHFSELVGTAFSLQDIASLKPGVIVSPFMGNQPLWSLSYEVAFYVAFPLALRVWVRSPPLASNTVGVIAVLGYASYLVVPNHFSLLACYFLIWWLGAMVAANYLSNRLTFHALLPEWGWMTVLCGTAMVGVLWRGNQGLGVFPVLPLRHFLSALGFALLSLSPLRHLLLSAAQCVARPVSSVAAISYGLYVLHWPVLVQSKLSNSVQGYFCGWLLLIALAVTCERWLMQVLPRAPRD